jgi:hypothetical protein
MSDGRRQSPRSPRGSYSSSRSWRGRPPKHATVGATQYQCGSAPSSWTTHPGFADVGSACRLRPPDVVGGTVRGPCSAGDGPAAGPRSKPPGDLRRLAALRRRMRLASIELPRPDAEPPEYAVRSEDGNVENVKKTSRPSGLPLAARCGARALPHRGIQTWLGSHRAAARQLSETERLTPRC